MSPTERPELVALLDMGLVLLAATAAWQIVVRRRPVAGVLAVGVGLAYRWTVEPPAQAAVAGALAVAGLAAVLALASWEGGGADRAFRRVGGALVIGGASVALAAALGSGPARAGDAWLGWKQWEVGSADRTGASLDLAQSYGTLSWPDKPQVAMIVSSPRALPLRAVSLDEFDGVSFAPAGGGGGISRALPINAGIISAGDGTDIGEQLTQRVTMVASSSQLVFASGRPQSIRGPFSGASAILGDAVRVDERLQPGASYTVETLIPEPTPAELVAARPYHAIDTPAGETRLRATLWSDPVVDVPLWGSRDPQPSDADLGPYAPVRELARSVAGDAATPYAAVNRIESYLRRNYTYDEAPPFPTSLPAGTAGGWPENRPPLVDFLLNSRRGFCQQFAGAMAVMLRSLGIPSRVAVGYTGGQYDPGRKAYLVLDRDAHAWVEVWFPGEGWIPFDPTPGRSVPNPASVSSADYAPSRTDVSVSGLAGAAVGATGDPRAAHARAERAQAQARPGARARRGRGRGRLGVAMGARGTRRAPRRGSGGPRRSAPAPSPGRRRARPHRGRRARPRGVARRPRLAVRSGGIRRRARRPGAGAHRHRPRRALPAGRPGALRSEPAPDGLGGGGVGRGPEAPPGHLPARPLAPALPGRAGSRRAVARYRKEMDSSAEAYEAFRHGEWLLSAREFRQAAVALERAKALEPDKGSIREALGRAYLSSRAYHRAAEEFAAAVELAPTDGYAHYGLARSLERLGDPLAARHYRLARFFGTGLE